MTLEITKCLKIVRSFSRMQLARYQVDKWTMVSYRDAIVTALIADDDPVGLMLMESLLQSMSIETHSADTVAGAKALITQFRPSIAILDVQLPDGDGLDILLALREANLHAPVAFITASLDDFPFYKCTAVQPDKMFSKPLNESEVRAWIEQTMRSRGLSIAARSKAG